MWVWVRAKARVGVRVRVRVGVRVRVRIRVRVGARVKDPKPKPNLALLHQVKLRMQRLDADGTLLRVRLHDKQHWLLGAEGLHQLPPAVDAREVIPGEKDQDDVRVLDVHLQPTDVVEVVHAVLAGSRTRWSLRREGGRAQSRAEQGAEHRVHMVQGARFESQSGYSRNSRAPGSMVPNADFIVPT